ncbi:methyltransferase domain-containing protein [Halobellus sp. EA9]|uniref:methyltransferase domain-containing protein n=1 Tax=Halobellus sp. EA9 TaxID=3421647 RepID=UPI003EC04910
MDGLFDAALANPWGTLETVLDGPLHPGGTEATARLLDRADVGPGTRVLDVGCGAGDALRVARERGARAFGVDPDPPRNTDRTIRGDATALPVRTGAVDVLLAECVLCLTDLPTALEEARRVLDRGGRIALSDVVVEGGDLDVPDRMAEALCLNGARSRERLTSRLADAGFDVEHTAEHREELLAMRDRVADRVDYKGILGLMGDRGRRALDAIAELEAAVEAGRVSYVSLVASA